MRSLGLLSPVSGADCYRFYFSPKPTAVRPDCIGRVRFGPVRAATSSRTEEGLAATTFYDLLGVLETGTMPEIKHAYKQMARKYHPDVSPPDRVEEYTRQFIRLQEAYETLSDPRRRAVYDRDLARGLHLAFSARKPYKFDEDFEDKSEWKSRWQPQLWELKRRSSQKSSIRGNMSWGARMRRQREEPSDEP
ncbi:hypothetical protein SAY87_003677 [Trapa incisa]|uniref:J domain-containing protein n=1 Tax=Trapa incisa TaxID=236973 RepID=A0AAN7KJP9_9MYRT|nr:hypothetical protein SAY87_003677 [Trapa incisa]